MVTGHLFLVHGKLESVTHDAAVVPTSQGFGVRSYWGPILGLAEESVGRGWASSHQPEGWGADLLFGPSPRDPAIWMLNSVTRGTDAPVAELVARVLGVLDAVASSGLSSSNGRRCPIVALPVVGIAGAGLGDFRGSVVKALVHALLEWVARHPIDVALVTPDAAVHAAAQSVRLGRVEWPLSLEFRQEAERLGGLARQGQLALFFGAGVSQPAGLPTWDKLLADLADSVDDVDPGHLEGLSFLDQAQLLATEGRDLGAHIQGILRPHARPALGHALLAALGCREAVTTNYDSLYEKAMEAASKDIAAVLPKDRVSATSRWVLKMHGDIERPDSIVLTRGDFVTFDSVTRPSGSILQSLLLTRHVLIVGASMTDDNVIRLAYEVNAYRRRWDRDEEYGTLLDVQQRGGRAQLWSGQLAWHEMPGETLEDRCRMLEIFLDAVSAFAASDSSWLLDKRFADLLSDKQGSAQLAAEARAFYDRLCAVDHPEWASLRAAFRKLGVDGRVDDQD